MSLDRILLADNPNECINKMRAVFTLRRSLGTDTPFSNSSSVQKTVRCSHSPGYVTSGASWDLSE